MDRGGGMKRRAFILLLGGAAVFPLAARAQPAKLPVIGVLAFGNPEPQMSLLREGLRDHGYVDGQTMQFLPRNAEGSSTRLAELAAELVRLKVDIIIALQTPAVQAAKKATSEIPIVMGSAGDPVGTVSSRALRGPAATSPASRERRRSSARKISSSSVRSRLQRSASLCWREPAQALIVQPSLPRSKAIELMLKHRLPAISPIGTFARDGGLISYSSSPSWVREAAPYVDKILKGAKPADLPVQQPTRFELVLNLKTAQALGLTIPPTLLARADEVIE